MVSLNLFQYREKVKRALLARKDELNQEWDPFAASWLAYAFLREQVAPSLLAQELFERLEAWSQEESAWQFRRNVAPLLFLIWLKKQFGHTSAEAVTQKVVKALLDLNPDDKFSPWRYPEQVFLMALGISALERQETQSRFIKTLSSQMRGSLARQVLLAAAVKETGGMPDLPSLQPADATDILVMLWWAERYGQGDKSHWWAQFESIADTVSLHKMDKFDTRRILSEWELVLLYEALLQQTNRPDPKMLFNYYPLHPSIKSIAEDKFHKGEYFGAVLEACKLFYDILRKLSDEASLSEVNVVKKVLGDPNAEDKNLNPIVKLNPLDPKSLEYRSQVNEQKGFGHLGIGVFKAFRHPKGHEHEGKEWVKIDPYEALDQLIVISLVIKRIEEAIGSKL